MNRVTSKRFGVYAILNIKNGCLYIGSTAMTFRKRYGEHIRLLRRGVHNNQFLQNAWNKYGEGAFRFMVLKFCTEKSVVCKSEQEYIDHALSIKRNLYNLSAFVGSPSKDPEVAKRIGLSQRIAMKGKSPSQATRDAVSLSNRTAPHNHKDYPELMNVYTNESAPPGIYASLFAREHGFTKTNFIAMLNGRIRHCAGWVTLEAYNKMIPAEIERIREFELMSRRRIGKKKPGQKPGRYWGINAHLAPQGDRGDTNIAVLRNTEARDD